MIAPVIFILIGNTDYENDEIVAAYESKGAADAEASRLNDLLAEEPSCPRLDDSDAVWDRYNRAEKKWRKKFPRSDLASCDTFSVRETDFIVAVTPAEDSPCTPPPGA